MKKSEVEKLEDKNLQLRYFLGGLQTMNNNEYCHYWLCDINCSCNIVPEDDRLEAVKSFIKKHNITNERFLKLAYNYLTGSIMKYKGNYSKLFIELDEVLKPYQFNPSYNHKIPDNDFREKELEEIVFDSKDLFVKKYIEKYNLTEEDFITLAKTSINHNIYGLRLSNQDTFMTEITDFTYHYGLNVTKEFIEAYRKENQIKKETAELIAAVTSSRKKYLESIRDLLPKDKGLANQIINEDLAELASYKKKVKTNKLV